MNLTGTVEQLSVELYKKFPAAVEALYKSRAIHRQLEKYQAVALYGLAQRYNKDGAHFLEVGTLAGFSASIIAQAAPLAQLTTLNCKSWEVATAKATLLQYKNVKVTEAVSWEYLATYKGFELDFIFVDGNHNRVAQDIPWFNWLKPGGMMLFHDYSPLTSCVVYDTVNLAVTKLGRQIDVMIMDDNKVGMAGIIKRAGDVCPM